MTEAPRNARGKTGNSTAAPVSRWVLKSGPRNLWLHLISFLIQAVQASTKPLNRVRRGTGSSTSRFCTVVGQVAGAAVAAVAAAAAGAVVAGE